jgi:hypothetical protein
MVPTDIYTTAPTMRRMLSILPVQGDLEGSNIDMPVSLRFRVRLP